MSVIEVEKICCLLAAILAITSARGILSEGIEIYEHELEYLLETETYIFENKILEGLKELKSLLKNGDPSKNIPPMDPYFHGLLSFDFILNDTALNGFFKNLTIANFSNFEPTNVEFKLIPLSFKIDIFLDKLWLNGSYKLVGHIFDNINVNGTGVFTSETKNLTLSLFLKPIKVDSNLQLKDIVFRFEVGGQKINYTNELEGGKRQELDEKLALEILNKAQAKYIPPLLNTVKQVVNHFLLGYSFQDIMKFILDLINNSKTVPSLLF